ncbi:15186_t:CDS:2, partial [Dentiscutata heterogama]
MQQVDLKKSQNGNVIDSYLGILQYTTSNDLEMYPVRIKEGTDQGG